jgi:hypothetical protein
VHLPQEPQELQAPQEAQLPPQEDFPAFLSRIMPRISSTTTAAITATRRMLIRLAESQPSIQSRPSIPAKGLVYGYKWQRCGKEGEDFTALPTGRKGIPYY